MDQAEYKALFERSDAFQEEVVKAVNTTHLTDKDVTNLWPLIVIVHGHAASVRLLIQYGMANSGLSLMRVLYDAVVRQMWAGYCASPEQLEILHSNLSPEALHDSIRLPTTSKMLQDLKSDGPPVLFELLDQFKTHSWKPLNSVIHTGLHALHIARSGLPTHMAATIIKQSNNLLHMSAYQIALYTECVEIHEFLVELADRYEDCLQLLSNPAT